MPKTKFKKLNLGKESERSREARIEFADLLWTVPNDELNRRRMVHEVSCAMFELDGKLPALE